MNSKQCPKCNWCNPDDAASCRQCGCEFTTIEPKQLTPTQRVEQEKFDASHDDSHIRFWAVPVEFALELAAELERMQAALKSTQTGLHSIIDHWTKRAQKSEQELERVQKELNESIERTKHYRDNWQIAEQGRVKAYDERDELRRQLNAKHDALEKTMATYEAAHTQNVELRRQVEELKIGLQLTASARITAELNCDQLRAENAELLKDKERLDWLEKHMESFRFISWSVKNPCEDIDHHGEFSIGYDIEKEHRGIYKYVEQARAKTIRQAIDAAKGDIQ